MKFSMNDFFSKCDQIGRKLRIWSHLLKKSLMENSIFCAVIHVLCESSNAWTSNLNLVTAKKMFPLRISSVNVIKFAGNCKINKIDVYMQQ